MSIMQQFSDGVNKALEGCSEEEVNQKLDMLSNAFKENSDFQECSIKALVNKREPEVRCVHCDKIFLVDEVIEKMGCPDCCKDDFEMKVETK